MIASLNASPVSSISLLGCCVPDQIILTFIIRPGWELNLLDTKGIGNTGDNDIKATCIGIVVLDFQRPLGLGNRNLSSRTAYAD